MITFRNVTLRHGANILLQNVNWTIYQKQRIGVIGSNGCGKTSLFSMLLGRMQPDVGDLDLPSQLRLAHVAQETPAYHDTALNYVLDGDVELRELEKVLLAAEEADDGMRIAHLHEKLAVIDAYTAPARAGQLLAGLGFNAEEQQKPVSAFSGGWRVRLNLAKALMSRSDILLLDEPTNHLDLDAVLWLEQWLQNYQGTLLLISHDRDFLDKTVNHIVHISHQNLKLYSGDYSTFETQRANDLMVQQAQFQKQQKHLAHMQAFVERFRYKASKAKQAQSRLKAIERLELISAVQSESEFQFSFKSPDYCPNPLLVLDRAGVSYGEKLVLKNVDISIAPKDRIAMLGPNGAGKSTLIKLLAAELESFSGDRTASAGLKIGYFDQHQVDRLRLDESPLQHLRDYAEKEAELVLRKFLGSFGFSGDRVTQAVKHFSGGEKSRLALALIVWQEPNLLLLDEPTNHLDLEMRNALSLALQEYEGAMILVSHDRFLVRSTTDKLMLVADKKITDFEGDLDDYQKWLLDYRKQEANNMNPSKNSAEPNRKELRQLEAKAREAKRPLMQKIQKLENELLKFEKILADYELVLADSKLYEPESKTELDALLQKQAVVKNQIEQTESAWLLACEERDRSEYIDRLVHKRDFQCALTQP